MVSIRSSKALLLVALSAISLASEQTSAQSQDEKEPTRGNPLSEEFGRYVTGLMNEWKVPGLSVAVIDGDQVYTQGYGFAILPDTPVKPDTLFLGGSTTKAHVAAALAHLIAAGDHNAGFRRGWGTPISSIIRDDFVLQDEWATAHLTLEDAVSHRTGMPRHDIAWTATGEPNDTSNARTTNKATVRKLRNLPPTAEPRVVFQYSNMMYVTLSHVIETVTGSWLGDVLRKAIWQPLDMESTFLSYKQARQSGLQIATGYFWDEEAREYVGVETDPVQFSSGAGAIISTAVDYSKWVKCLLQKTAPFSAATHEDIRAPRMMEYPVAARSWGVRYYGLGWEITTFHGEAVYKHDGGTQNFGTNVMWMPDIKFGVVAFANAVDTGNFVEEVLTQKLVEDRLGIPVKDRHDYSEEKKKQMEQDKRDFDNATNIIYPNHATDPPSFSVDYDLLAGKYSHPSYGTYTFIVENSTVPVRGGPAQQPPTKQLVALREDAVVPTRHILRHVVGEYWVAYLITIFGPTSWRTFYAAKFIMGADGKPSALEIKWQDGTDRLAPVVTRFSRVG